MRTRKILVVACLLLGALATVFDGMLLMGFTKAVQYTWNFGFFVVLLPLGIALYDYDNAKELL